MPASTETLETIYGLRAGLAVLAKRPADVAKIAYTSEVEAEVLPRVPKSVRDVRRVDGAELERLAGSVQHEGLALRVAPRQPQKASILVKQLAAGDLLVALDRVRNPYNIGAILRTAAFYGAKAVLLDSQLSGTTERGLLDPLAVRVAEGGAEHLAISLTTDLANTLGKLREAGARILGTDVHGTLSAIAPHKTGATVLVLGNEREGLSERILAQCTDRVTLRGAGTIESLNVGVAAGILIAALRP
jgi:RNA methyltransferase, TrmH family